MQWVVCVNYIIKNDVTFTFYQYDRIEKAFISLVCDIIRKYPFKFHFFMSKVISRSQVTFIRDTSIIMGLDSFEHHEQQMIFEIIRKFSRIKAISRVIDKKEFLIIHLHSPKISEFFMYSNRWLSYLLYQTYCDLYGDYGCHLGVIVNEPDKGINVGEMFIERLGKQFLVFSHGSQSRFVTRLTVRPIFLYTSHTQMLDLKKAADEFDCLRYCYNPDDFKKIVKNYFDNPCNFLTNIV
jgi:hypothetical protein